MPGSIEFSPYKPTKYAMHTTFQTYEKYPESLYTYITEYWYIIPQYVRCEESFITEYEAFVVIVAEQDESKNNKSIQRGPHKGALSRCSKSPSKSRPFLASLRQGRRIHKSTHRSQIRQSICKTIFSSHVP